MILFLVNTVKEGASLRTPRFNSLPFKKRTIQYGNCKRGTSSVETEEEEVEEEWKGSGLVR